MRLKKLHIKKYKNLRDFTWEVNPDHPIAVIVGKNGSGKTNLLEAIITIFQDLQLYSGQGQGHPPSRFTFELIYQHQENTVTIKNTDKLEIQLNQEVVPLYNLLTLLNKPFRGGEDLLPRNIFIYYAGTSNRIRNLTRRSNAAFRRLLLQDTSQSSLYYDATQPLFYYEPIHYKFVFFLLLITTLSEIKKDYLENDFGIHKLESVSFFIEKPDDNRSKNEETFWDAPPKLASFLNFIRANGTKKEASIGRQGGRGKHRWIYTVPPEKFSAISIRDFGSETGLFQMLSSLHLTYYLKDMEIYFHKKGLENVIEFDDLSEGEKQRLAVRGAMELFRGIETLYLLDEPDTFAHPRWQWDFIPDIQEAIGERHFSQVVFITHSPLVLSTAKDNAFLMEEGKIYPLQETFGQDANTSLVKMDAQEQPNDVENDFKHYFDLIKEGMGESDDAKEERMRLEQIYGLNHSQLSKADIWISFYK